MTAWATSVCKIYFWRKLIICTKGQRPVERIQQQPRPLDNYSTHNLTFDKSLFNIPDLESKQAEKNIYMYSTYKSQSVLQENK